MRKYLRILFVILLISCEKENKQIDFRDNFLGEYCCEEATFDYDFCNNGSDCYSYNLSLIEVKKGEIDSEIVITINQSNSYSFILDSDSSLRQTNAENSFYPNSGKFIGDSIYISIPISRNYSKSYKGKKYDTNLKYTESSIVDIEGKTIKTLTIDGTTWLAENLNVTHDKNGHEIPTSSYKYISENCGIIYSLEIADDVCPIGWHIPSKEEWDNLIRKINTYPDCYFTNLIHKDFIDLLKLNSKCYSSHPFETIESEITNVFWSSSVEEYSKIPFHVYFETYNNNYDSLYYRVLCEGLEENDKLFLRCIKDN